MNGDSLTSNSKKDHGSTSIFKILLVDDNPVNMVLNNRMMKSIAPPTGGSAYCVAVKFDL